MNAQVSGCLAGIDRANRLSAAASETPRRWQLRGEPHMRLWTMQTSALFYEYHMIVALRQRNGSHKARASDIEKRKQCLAGLNRYALSCLEVQVRYLVELLDELITGRVTSPPASTCWQAWQMHPEQAHHI